MASRAEELRKLAARVTTAAGDVSAVSGTSISEILDFMRENLNVNGEGKLIVSKLKKLGALFSYKLNGSEPQGQQFFGGLIDSVGLEERTMYDIKISYNGKEYSWSGESDSKELADEYYMGTVLGRFSIDGGGSIEVSICDSLDKSQSVWDRTYAEGKCSIVLYVFNLTEPLGEIKLISIEKA